MFCKFCGKEIPDDSLFCKYCGKQFEQNTTNNATAKNANRTTNKNVSLKSKTTCLLLCLFIGGLGAHRFYAGKIGSAIGMIALYIFGLALFGMDDESGAGAIFLIVAGIWIIVDLVMIAVGKFTDKDGKLISVWE